MQAKQNKKKTNKRNKKENICRQKIFSLLEIFLQALHLTEPFALRAVSFAW